MDQVTNEERTVSKTSKYSRDSLSYSSALTLQSHSSLVSSTSVDADRSDTELDQSSEVTDTLSMISTPWSTETRCSVTEPLLLSADSLETCPFTYWPLSSNKTDVLTSLDPFSTTHTSCIPTPTVKTYSKTTLTWYSFAATPCLSDQLHLPPVQVSSSSSGTLSSWTPELVTSGELFSSESSVVRVQYPWSPPTKTSCTDYYPNSMNTCSQDLVPRQESQATLRPETPTHEDMMALSFDSKVEYHELDRNINVFDKSLANANYFPMLCTVI
uniref:Uncharacterized protein n=1 Tax=Heliothis virescens TaxID=7102 RepID=A0A2A4JFZ8_HELVI